MIRLALTALLISCLALASCAGAGAETPKQYRYNILAEQPHGTDVFTQGLLMHNGLFYESSGRYGQSRLIRYSNDGRKPQRIQALDNHYFAEGLAELDGVLYLLTWRENTLLMFDREDFTPLSEQHYTGEGWGLTHDAEQFIRTDGSHYLLFHSLDDFQLTHRVPVTEQGQPVRKLNELEYIDGHVWANIWKSNRIVQIDPHTGQVVGVLDLEDLARRTAPPHPESVLNGIAYDRDKDAIWVTGKNWPTMFLLELE